MIAKPEGRFALRWTCVYRKGQLVTSKSLNISDQPNIDADTYNFSTLNRVTYLKCCIILPFVDRAKLLQPTACHFD